MRAQVTPASRSFTKVGTSWHCKVRFRECATLQLRECAAASRWGAGPKQHLGSTAPAYASQCR